MGGELVPLEAKVESILMEAETGFVKREPAIVFGIAGAVVSAVASTLVTHHVIGTVTASADTQQAIPAVAAGLMLLFGFVLRHFVSPALPPLTPSDDAPATIGLTHAQIDTLNATTAQIRLDGKAIATAIRRVTKPPDEPPAAVPAAVPPTSPLPTGGLMVTPPQTFTSNPTSTLQTIGITPPEAMTVGITPAAPPVPVQGDPTPTA